MEDNIKPLTNQGFFSYVFKLSKFKQEDLLNISQYMALTIIPTTIFIYMIKKYFPDITHEDSSLYICVLTFIELLFMIVGIFFIDRIVNYIPTYSGKYYEPINLINVITLFTILMLTSRAGFRERTAILLHRFDNWFTVDNWIASKLGLTPKPFNLYAAEAGQYNLEVGRSPGDGRPDIQSGAKGKAGGKAKNKHGGSSNQQASQQTTLNSQISQQYAVPPPLPVQGPSISNYGGGGGMMQQPVQNFNSMYANTSTPLVDAATPGMGDMYMEPEAANGALGGSSWSSW
jgi:hypothetical protein